MLGLVGTASHGSNMGSVGRQFELCQEESNSPCSYEDRSPRNTKQQTNKTVRHWAVLLMLLLVLVV